MTPILSTTLLRTQSDGRLAELAGGGSERAFEAIVERYRRPLRRYCARFVGESRAEDAVQDVFVKAWTALQAGPAVKDLRPWLYRIAHNTSLNALRKHGYDYVELQESIRSAHGEPEAEQERRGVVLSTLSGLAALPDAQREALLRTAVDGLSQDEVARELGISEPAVRGLVYRARETLRTAATALTPSPLLNWLLGLGGSGGGTPRIAELVATSGGAAGAGVMVKAGALISAGVVATGAVALKPLSPRHATPSAAAETPARVIPSRAPVSQAGGVPTIVSGDDSSRSGRGRDGRSGGNDHSGSSGSGSDDRRSGDGHSGSGSSGGDDSRSGSSDSGSSGSGSGLSGSGSSGSGSSGPGSGSSDSRGSDDPVVATPVTDDSSGSGGSGSSGSGSSDSSGSGSGSAGSGSSGPSTPSGVDD